MAANADSVNALDALDHVPVAGERKTNLGLTDREMDAVRVALIRGVAVLEDSEMRTQRAAAVDLLAAYAIVRNAAEHYEDDGEMWGTRPCEAWVFPNGNVATFDSCGHQCPAYQGPIEKVGDRLVAVGVIIHNEASVAG